MRPQTTDHRRQISDVRYQTSDLRWRKGQAIIEYLIIAGLMVAAFIAVIGVVKQKAMTMSTSVVSDIPNFPIP